MSRSRSSTARRRRSCASARCSRSGASTASLRWTVEVAQSAGATDEEILDVLVAIGPAVGLACVVAGAPRLALAMGYEIDDEG